MINRFSCYILNSNICSYFAVNILPFITYEISYVVTINNDTSKFNKIKMSFKLHYIHILEKLFHHNLTLMHVELNWIYFFQATCVYLKRRNQTKKRSKRSGWKVPWNKKRGFSLQLQWNKIDVVGRRTFQVSAENERENVRKSNRIVLWWEVKFQTFVCICVWEYVV